MSAKIPCTRCEKLIRKGGKSGLCRPCYQSGPEHKEQYAKVLTNGMKQSKREKNFSEWKLLRDEKKLRNTSLELLSKYEKGYKEHQQFVYKVLADRIVEVKEDFQRKAFTYWKLNELIKFLEKDLTQP
jgi:hypothetical protein|tara:strand:+ start:626 stop:1009 length:384 start_codon:yes stop_codon:yes gene_type:complete